MVDKSLRELAELAELAELDRPFAQTDSMPCWDMIRRPDVTLLDRSDNCPDGQLSNSWLDCLFESPLQNASTTDHPERPCVHLFAFRSCFSA